MFLLQDVYKTTKNHHPPNTIFLTYLFFYYKRRDSTLPVLVCIPITTTIQIYIYDICVSTTSNTITDNIITYKSRCHSARIKLK